MLKGLRDVYCVLVMLMQKAGDSTLNRDQIKRTIPLDMQNKRPELKKGKSKKLFAQLSKHISYLWKEKLFFLTLKQISAVICKQEKSFSPF